MPENIPRDIPNTTGDELDVGSIPADEILFDEDTCNQAQPDKDTADLYIKQLADDEHQKNIENLESLKQDRTQRKEFTGKIYWLICLWLSGVAIILLLRAWSVCGFCLSDTVLIALITTTSANVIGLLAIVVLYLFPRKQK